MRPGSVYIIAEMACSHEGDLNLAKRIVDSAGRAGADAVQFQVWSLNDLVAPSHSDYAKLFELELSRDEWSTLIAYSQRCYPEMETVACVYEVDSVEFCEKHRIDAYKIHSSDIMNRSLLRKVGQTKKRVHLSVGASQLNEIQDGVERLKANSTSSICLMFGYQDFPTSPNDVHLDYMIKLKQLFELPIGYQDHTDGGMEAAFWIPAAAIGMGVDLIEKHLTHDRAFLGADHEAALDPTEFKRFVTMVRTIERAKGIGIPRFLSEAEKRYRTKAKRYAFSKTNLCYGSRIKKDHLVFLRSDGRKGFLMEETDLLVGRRLKRDLSSRQLITPADVEDNCQPQP